MDKNFLLAFLLSTVAIFLYYILFQPSKRFVEQPVKKETAIVKQIADKGQPDVKKIIISEVGKSSLSLTTVVERKEILVESEFFTAKIDSREGVLTSFLLKKYKYQSKPHFNIIVWIKYLFIEKVYKVENFDPSRAINMIGDQSEKNQIWRVMTGNSDSAIFYRPSSEYIKVTNKPEMLVLQAMLPSGIEVTKKITFYPKSYLVNMEVNIANRTAIAIRLSPRINFGAGNEAVEGELLPSPKLGISYIEDNFVKYDADDFEYPVRIKQSVWAGVMDTYFITVAKLHNSGVFNSELSPLESVLNGDEITVPNLEFVDDPVLLKSNQAYSRKIRFYIGPKVKSEMEKFDLNLFQAVDLGWFGFLSHPLLSVLRWLQQYVINWGVAIILLTIIVRVALFPLAFIGMRSMRKMSQLNPKIKTIREKHKSNKELMNKEIMQFYRQHKINPAGGCLPMVLQIPIFIALYKALFSAIELRHTPFIFWLDDLAAVDFTFILPILMGITMFAQQKLTPTPAMDPTQQKIMKLMPVMMVFFFHNMPAGLVLYWVVSNLLTIGQQLIFNKVTPVLPIEVETKKREDKKQNLKKKN